VISTKKRVVIKREDFQLTGETMEFNMKTRQGSLGGGVKMLIYNIEQELAAAPEPKAP
jgi:lipopolysaccharide export system protein LptC